MCLGYKYLKCICSDSTFINRYEMITKHYYWIHRKLSYIFLIFLVYEKNYTGEIMIVVIKTCLKT